MIEWDYPDPFVYEVDVVQQDIDSFGHANNTVYLRWLTECAWAHSAAVGLPEAKCIELRRGMAVRGIHVELLGSAYLGDKILVANWLTKRNRLRATRVYQVMQSESEQTLLRGEVNFVCIDLDSGRPVRMPPEFEIGYEETLNEPAP